MRPTRRSTLGLALGTSVALGAGLAGCDLDDAASGTRTPAAAAADPDRALLDGVLADLDARLALVALARSTYPRLQQPLAGLEAMHRAHRDVLSPDPAGAAGAPPATGRTARAALRRVRSDEEAHRTALVEAAVAARSGALARLLGSMAASVAQHLTVLPAELPGPPADGAS